MKKKIRFVFSISNYANECAFRSLCTYSFVRVHLNSFGLPRIDKLEVSKTNISLSRFRDKMMKKKKSTETKQIYNYFELDLTQNSFKFLE